MFKNYMKARKHQVRHISMMSLARSPNPDRMYHSSSSRAIQREGSPVSTLLHRPEIEHRTSYSAAVLQVRPLPPSLPSLLPPPSFSPSLPLPPSLPPPLPPSLYQTLLRLSQDREWRVGCSLTRGSTEASHRRGNSTDVPGDQSHGSA